MTVSSLSTALSGLKAAQSSINVVSTNITNASTEGYTRKTLPQQALVTQAGEGLGVQVQEAVRKVDAALLRDMFDQKSVSEAAGVKEAFLSRLMDFHGSTDAGNSISTQMADLKDTFAELSASPDDAVLLNSVVSQARSTATKFNDMSGYLTKLRNDTQTELRSVVDSVNNTLDRIADLNKQISSMSVQGRSTASLEDQRDVAMQELSQYMEVKYYNSGNGKISVMTNEGATLVNEEARHFQFEPTPLGTNSSLENGGAAQLTLKGANINIDMTEKEMGGQMQALLELRDQTLPQYTAQLDELAQKTATRFAEQGLNLFVDENGKVPANVAPPNPVDYVGFAEQMRVNDAVIENPNLIRTGTSGEAVQDGSNTVVDRVLEFTFGNARFYQSKGTTDISSGTIFNAAGLEQKGQMVGNRDLTEYNPLTEHPDIDAGTSFTVDTGSGPVSVTVGATDGATDLVNNINTAAGSNIARLNGMGQLVIEANADITIADSTMGTAGLNALGLSAGTTAAKNPQFNVQVGQESPVTITIEPGDTQADLLNDLNAIDGITASLSPGGELLIQTLDGNGVNRGKLTMNDGLGSPLNTMGVKTSAVSHAAFRNQNLGPDANIKSGISGVTTLTDFSKSMIAVQSEDHARAASESENSSVFFNTLNERFLNETGVDIDQELTELIKFQTAYTAATQLISASEEQFDELIAALR